MEDRKGSLWFGSIGEGVYHYDGKTFQNFNTDDGLVNNEIVSIYEDKNDHIWFGVNGGVSQYDGVHFRNYRITADSIIEDTSSHPVPNMQRPMHEVNSIMEDKAGKLWFATRGNTYIYDGNTFNILKQNDQPFTNVRWLLNDSKGNIWLGGNDGLWYYDGNTYASISTDFTGYIYEDSKGNIWTSSQRANGWALSHYDNALLTDNRTASEIKTGEGMFFGILEDSGGNVWVGTLDGVYRYDGNTFEDFR